MLIQESVTSTIIPKISKFAQIEGTLYKLAKYILQKYWNIFSLSIHSLVLRLQQRERKLNVTDRK